jgi:NADP-dependent 3-hydroxy acid dehydrogenase YdfG
MLFKGAVVMITGGAAGIGAACARKFEDIGAKVSVNDINAASLPESDSYLFTQGDITDGKVRQQFVARTLQKFGRVDILVNNAGVGIYAGASGTDLDEARAMFELNVFAALAMSQAVIPHFRRQESGLIINIGSIGGLVTLPWSTLYCASKYALHSISAGLRREFRGSGIHFMTVVAGIVATQFREHVLSGQVPAGVANLRFVISPDDLAGSIVRAAQSRKAYLYNPAIGRLFVFIDRLLPGIMDRFIQRQWAAVTSSSQPLVKAMPQSNIKGN